MNPRGCLRLPTREGRHLASCRAVSHGCHQPGSATHHAGRLLGQWVSAKNKSTQICVDAHRRRGHSRRHVARIMNFTIVIKRGIPMPLQKWHSTGKLASLRLAFSKMRVGEHFDWGGHPTDPYRAARSMGARIRTEKISGQGTRVWLKSKPQKPVMNGCKP